jgi:hypothetical protein
MRHPRIIIASLALAAAGGITAASQAWVPARYVPPRECVNATRTVGSSVRRSLRRMALAEARSSAPVAPAR